MLTIALVEGKLCWAYQPAEIFGIQHMLEKGFCNCCHEHVEVADQPPSMIEKGAADASLLSHLTTSKQGDHLPLYRQSQIFEREGIDLDRSTLCGWVGKSTALLEPLADAIGRHVLRGPAIFADDTPIKMQVPGNGRTKTARIWMGFWM